MKSQISLLVVLVLIAFASCKQPAAPVVTPENADLKIRFSNKINGTSLIQDSLMYTNASGNLFSVHLLKYYITNVVLVKDDGTEVKLNNYDLIDAFDPAYAEIAATAIPNGNYTSMKFMMGVDSTRNHTGSQTGDLDPALNMYWSWSTGYIFFKHEGDFKDASNATQPILFHLGSDRSLSSIQIPIGLNINGVAKSMNLNFDLSKMYNSPLINFNVDNNRMSTSAADSTWIKNMVTNTNDAFTFVSVE